MTVHQSFSFNFPIYYADIGISLPYFAEKL